MHVLIVQNVKNSDTEYAIYAFNYFIDDFEYELTKTTIRRTGIVISKCSS